MGDLFVEAERKIARAGDHIAELERRILEFEERFKVPQWEHIPFNGIVRITSPIRADEVDYLGEVMGDALHCLRVSLDRMAVELVRLSRGNPKSVYFPMGTDQAQLVELVKSKNFDRAGQDAVDLLMSLAPHAGPGGNILARAMHDFDVTDKHQAVVKTVQVFKMPTIFFDPFPGGKSVWSGNRAVAPLGKDPVVHLRALKVDRVQPAERGIEDTPLFDLAFHSGLALGERPVVPALHEMAGMTQDIVEAFGALFRARN